MQINVQVFYDYFGFLFTGVWLTLALTVVSVCIGIVMGLFLSLGKLSTIKPVKTFTAIYIDVIRGTPLLAQIFFIHYGLPQIFQYVPNVILDAIISLAINCSAYIAEIFRGGIQSIERGQGEAALSLGMTPGQSMRYVVLPQAVRRVLPPLGNVFISMLKDSSMVSVISMQELLFKGMIAAGQSFRPFEIWIMVAALYLMLTLPFSRLVAWAEKRMVQT
ncbi:MAG: amino acid ABC transporter permease [Syntrophomonadaceae bacterium]|nr:amino acid ABC transporter permease [Syntrophomonadaceae bacterium]